MEDPEYKKACADRLHKINADPEIRKARSERAKAQWAAGNIGRKAKA